MRYKKDLRSIQRVSVGSQGVRRGFRRFSAAFQKDSEDFQQLSETLQGILRGYGGVKCITRGPRRLCGVSRGFSETVRGFSALLEVSGDLRCVKGGSKGFSKAFQEDSSEVLVCVTWGPRGFLEEHISRKCSIFSAGFRGITGTF